MSISGGSGGLRPSVNMKHGQKKGAVASGPPHPVVDNAIQRVVSSAPPSVAKRVLEATVKSTLADLLFHGFDTLSARRGRDIKTNNIRQLSRGAVIAGVNAISKPFLRSFTFYMFDNDSLPQGVRGALAQTLPLALNPFSVIKYNMQIKPKITYKECLMGLKTRQLYAGLGPRAIQGLVIGGIGIELSYRAWTPNQSNTTNLLKGAAVFGGLAGPFMFAERIRQDIMFNAGLPKEKATPKWAIVKRNLFDPIGVLSKASPTGVKFMFKGVTFLMFVASQKWQQEYNQRSANE